MTTIVENAWKLQKRIEQKMQSWKKRLPNNDTLCWRHGDFSVYFLGMVLLFGGAVVIMMWSYDFEVGVCVTDWWVVPFGIGEVFLFLFAICKKVENVD